MPRQRLSRIGPEGSRATGSMDAHDRLPGTVLLVVKRYTVDTDLGHATSMRPPGGGPHRVNTPFGAQDRDSLGWALVHRSRPGPVQSRSRCSIAKTAAAARDETPIFAYRFSTWRPTVFGEMNRRSATSRFDRPRAIRRSTSTSRSVRSAGHRSGAGGARRPAGG